MIPQELARKIRYIEIYSSKLVNQLLAGQYHSVFKGQGVEFEEVRPYQPGDDVRSIDWNVTARTGEPFLKRYVEERQLVLFFLVDRSASGHFGSTGKSKNELAAEICALLAFSAIKNNDKVGLILFTDQIELFVPPGNGSSHVLRIIRDLLYHRPQHTGTDIRLALEYLGRVAKKRCVVFLVSDFQADGYQWAMRLVARRHDLIAVTMIDPREQQLPDVGLVQLRDAETGQWAVADTSSPAVRRRYEEAGRRRRQRLRRLLAALDVDQIEVETQGDYVRELVRFFEARERRQSGVLVR